MSHVVLVRLRSYGPALIGPSQSGLGSDREADKRWSWKHSVNSIRGMLGLKPKAG